MPALVCAVFFCLPGRWVQGAAGHQAEVWCAAVAFFGFGTGVVEEAVFRGAILHALARRWGRFVAVLVPSVLFGPFISLAHNSALAAHFSFWPQAPWWACCFRLWRVKAAAYGPAPACTGCGTW